MNGSSKTGIFIAAPFGLAMPVELADGNTRHYNFKTRTLRTLAAK